MQDFGRDDFDRRQGFQNRGGSGGFQQMRGNRGGRGGQQFNNRGGMRGGDF